MYVVHTVPLKTSGMDDIPLFDRLFAVLVNIDIIPYAHITQLHSNTLLILDYKSQWSTFETEYSDVYMRSAKQKPKKIVL